MYQYLKSNDDNTKNRYLSHRGIVDYLCDLGRQAKDPKDFAILKDLSVRSGDRKTPYNRYQIYVNDVDTSKRRYVDIDIRDPSLTYTESNKPKETDHWLALHFPRPSYDKLHLNRRCFINSREGRCYWYTGPENSCMLTYEPKAIDEDFYGLLAFLKRCQVEGPLVSSERPEIEHNKVIDSVEKTMMLNPDKFHEPLSPGLLSQIILDSLHTRGKVEIMEELTPDHYCTTKFLLKQGRSSHLLKFKTRVSDIFPDGYTEADPILSIYIPRYFNGRVNHIIDIMDENGSYVVRDESLMIIGIYHAHESCPGFDDLRSLLRHNGVKGDGFASQKLAKKISLDLNPNILNGV